MWWNDNRSDLCSKVLKDEIAKAVSAQPQSCVDETPVGRELPKSPLPAEVPPRVERPRLIDRLTPDQHAANEQLLEAAGEHFEHEAKQLGRDLLAIEELVVEKSTQIERLTVQLRRVSSDRESAVTQVFEQLDLRDVESQRFGALIDDFEKQLADARGELSAQAKQNRAHVEATEMAAAAWADQTRRLKKTLCYRESQHASEMGALRDQMAAAIDAEREQAATQAEAWAKQHQAWTRHLHAWAASQLHWSEQLERWDQREHYWADCLRDWDQREYDLSQQAATTSSEMQQRLVDLQAHCDAVEKRHEVSLESTREELRAKEEILATTREELSQAWKLSQTATDHLQRHEATLLKMQDQERRLIEIQASEFDSFQNRIHELQLTIDELSGSLDDERERRGLLESENQRLQNDHRQRLAFLHEQRDDLVEQIHLSSERIIAQQAELARLSAVASEAEERQPARRQSELDELHGGSSQRAA